MHLDGPEGLSEHLDRRTALPIDLRNGEKIVFDQPKIGYRRVPGDDHDALPGHAHHFREASDRIGPVVHREDGQRCLKSRLSERQVCCRRLHDGCATRMALMGHRALRELDDTASGRRW